MQWVKKPGYVMTGDEKGGNVGELLGCEDGAFRR
jgi:hypothetical protein